MDGVMTYQSVRDIIPELISATEKGQIRWMMMSEEPNDFYVALNSYKIEVELKSDLEWDEEQLTLCMYLWNTSNKIIDSDFIDEKNPISQSISHTTTL